MKRRLLLLFALSGSLLCSCESEDLENWQVKKPNGQVASEKELSAGISTIFSNAPDAYDTQANWVTGELEMRFNRGDGLYDDARGVENVDGGGLGPLYAGYSCGSCHKSTRRTRPAIADGGSGPGLIHAYLYIVSGGYFQDYGRVLHDQAIYGTKPEEGLRLLLLPKNIRSPMGRKASWSPLIMR